MFDLVIKNARIQTEAQLFHGQVAVLDGRIAALASDAEPLPARETVDARGEYVLPGGVDPHVHIRYPGGRLRETFHSGTQAAAAGGVTTVIEHPISSPPQYSPATLHRRVEAMAAEAIVDVAFYGAAGGDFLDEISPLAAEGIVAFKTFLHAAPAGRDKEFLGLTSKDNYQLLRVMEAVAETGAMLAAHGEDNDLVSGGIAAMKAAGHTYNLAHCLSRPSIAETLAVERLISLARYTGARLYLVHLSCPESVLAAERARAEGLEVYMETCPHYLYMTEAQVERHGSFAKCNPPLRDAVRVEQLWECVSRGAMDTVGSDHAPYLLEEKTAHPDDIFPAPSGFPGLEMRLGYMLRAVKEGRITLARAVELISGNPARIFDLKHKGSIAVGKDADMVLLDADEPYTLRVRDLHTMAKEVCGFMEGTQLYGKVRKTWVRGRLVYDEGAFPAQPGYGRFVRPGEA